jgi:hypothetical protein
LLYGDISKRKTRVLSFVIALCSTLSLRCPAQDRSASAPLPEAPIAQTTSAAEKSATAQTAATSFVFATGRDRRKQYLTDLVGPGAFFSAGFQAAQDQAQSLKVGYPADGFSLVGLHPAHGAIPEWSEGLEGYSKRYASRFGMSLIGTTSRYGMGEILHQDVTYHPCQCQGWLPRTYHALSQSVVAHTRSGKAVPSLPALASPYIAAELATIAWYPTRYNASDALRTSTLLYYGLPIKNLTKEFLGR